MSNIDNALQHLDICLGERDQQTPMSFTEFMKLAAAKPDTVVRNIFQVFHDMVKSFVGEGTDEYSNDPESIHYIYYDCHRLFVEGSDHPFFADRLFANRLISLVESLKRGAQQNKIYIFEGPHGCGKSTFLNNILRKFEEYVNTEEGSLFETVWRLNRKVLGDHGIHAAELARAVTNRDEQTRGEFLIESFVPFATEDYIEVPCPSHDNPLLLIPKDCRHDFFADLFEDAEVRQKIFTQKEYDWLHADSPCTICSCLYRALLRKLKSPLKVLEMVYARQYHFDKRLGQGVSVFNPGDKPPRQNIITNPVLQDRINQLLRDSCQVKYIFSRYAKTNNGIYALMDIKSHNTERLIELHNIISEGVHKVDDIEEKVDSLFLALMNPEDEKNIEDYRSFLDRIEYIHISYVMDLATEVEIYRNVFGHHIDSSFLPRVLHNFARVIISTRLDTRSEALLEWIGDPQKYALYCDENLQLLKMEIYTGYIPTWLSEEDRKRFTAKRRRKIIAESEKEGIRGFSGRDSLKIFNEFFSTYGGKERLISMSILYNFFTRVRKDLNRAIPPGFLDSLLHMYDYTILQEVKESLYYYNEERISRDIQNYLFAISFEPGTQVTCTFTGDQLAISESFFTAIENHILGPRANAVRRAAFRKETQKEYTTKTLTQEIMLEKKQITKTTLYRDLLERHIHNLKEQVLEPFLDNENFRRAIKDYNKEAFKTYDMKIREDVTFLMRNLCSKHGYTAQGAQEVCIYVIDNDLARKFA